MSLFLQLASLMILLFHGYPAADWTSGPPNGTTLYACVGDDVIITWTYALSTGDVLHDIQWLYQGQSQEIIALFSHGVFVPLPAFASRVQLVANGGLQISHVTKSDSGNYSVEITGNDASNNIFHLQKHLILEITDHLMTSDLQLHVTLDPTAVLNNATNSYSIQLMCGPFLYQHEPPFDVQWLTPSGSLHGSSHYKNGQFFFLLPRQVTGGNYTCRMSASTAGTCLARDIEASVAVDAVATTLAIMQAKIDAQAAELRAQAEKADAQEAKLDAQAAKDDTQTAKLDAQAAKLDAQAAKLDAQAAELAVVKERNRLAVSFHAGELYPYNLKSGEHMVMTDVITNQGNGYSNTTGVFTAPVSGTYCFMATTGPYSKDQWAGLYIMRDQSEVGFAEARDGQGAELATTHAVIHLDVGQTVWLRAMHTAVYWHGSGNYFSGFLVSPNP